MASRGDDYASSLGLIARPRLEERLDEVFGKRLTAVVAGAGFGKSTLLRSWSSDVECAWCPIGAYDAALPSFARNLLLALGSRIEALGELAPRLDGSLEAEMFASTVCEMVASSVSHDLVLVVDDVHELGAVGETPRLLASLCQQAPTNLHIVLASRVAPPFPVARMRARGELLEVDAEALAFTASEIRELLGEFQDLDPSLADQVYQATAGWPAAVRLTLEALAAAPSAERGAALRGVHQARGSLFSYLAEEVFARESAAVRELLRRLAPLMRLRAGLPEAVGLPDGTADLEPLAARGLLVRATDLEGWYELHDLVRQFVLDRWPLPESELRDVHRSAARWFGEHGFLLEALHSAIATDDHGSIAALVQGYGRALLDSGQHQSLRDVAPRLRPEHRNPTIELLIGRAYHAAGEIDRAQECFERAAGDDPEIAPELARWMGEIGVSNVDYPAAIAAYDRASLGGENTTEEAMLLAARAWAHSALGDGDDAARYAERALAAATRSGEDAALAHAHHALGVVAYIAGRLDDGDRHTSSALKAAERAGDVHRAFQSRSNLVEALLERGAYAAALPGADESVRHLEIFGPLVALPDTLFQRGTIRLRLGRVEDALADFKLAISKTPVGEVWRLPPLIGVADVYRERGEAALARSAYEEALALAEQHDANQFVRPALSGLARVLALVEPKEATRLSEIALVAGTARQVETLIAAAWVYLAAGDPARAASLASEAARRSSESGIRSGLAEALEVEAVAGGEDARVARIEEARTLWQDLESPIGAARCEVGLARLSTRREARADLQRAERRLRKLGVRNSAGVAGLLAFIPAPTSAPVVVETLGGLRVLRDGEPVPKDAWQSRKARDLLKLLAVQRGHPLARDAGMDALWPGEAPDRLGNRLSVGLSTLRAVLDPADRFDSEYFVRADREAMWLDLSSLELDVDGFLRAATRGLELVRAGESGEARSFLEYAEEKYAGDLLEDDPYLEWAVQLREEARGAYIAVAYALAELALTEGARNQALRYLRRVLERDPFDERAHLLLASTLGAAGQHGEARRAYRVYCDRMQELELEASPFPSPP